jgi:hypothetical protein
MRLVQLYRNGVVANSNNRTGYFGEGSVYGVSKGSNCSSSASALTLRYNVGANAYAIIGDTIFQLVLLLLTFNKFNRLCIQQQLLSTLLLF